MSELDYISNLEKNDKVFFIVSVAFFVHCLFGDLVTTTPTYTKWVEISCDMYSCVGSLADTNLINLSCYRLKCQSLFLTV